MSTQLLSSKIVITEQEPRIKSVTSLPTAVLAMVGVTERGPIGQANLVTSFDEWVALYGGYTADALDTVAAVEGFFENGGQFLYFTRTVHYSDIVAGTVATAAKATLDINSAASAPSSGTVLGSIAEPFAFVDGDTLIVDVDGGGNDTATFNAAAASVTGANTETFALSDGQTLIFEVDGGAPQTVTFNTAEFVAIGAATALEVAAVINAEATGVSATTNAGAVVITSDKKGTDSSIGGFSGTANAALGFTGLSDTGSGDAADASAVSIAELKTLIEGDISGLTVSNSGGFLRITSDTTGAASSILVAASSTMDDELGLDNATHSGSSGAAAPTITVDAKTEGTYANSISIRISPATSGEATRFNLQVVDAGVIVETFPNLSLSSSDDNYVETIVNDVDLGSNLIQVEDLALGLVPAGSAVTGGTLHGPLAGGNDGLSGLVDNDFIGNEASETGLRSFDKKADITLLAVPQRATAAVQNAMITYAEVTRNMSVLAVLDPPANQSATQIITYVETTAALLESSEHGVMYWPRVEILNPRTALFGNVARVTVPPSGHICGMYARVDGSGPGGVYKPPAGVQDGVLRGVLGFEGGENSEVLSEAKRDLVFPKRINPITTLPGLSRFVDGARTLKASGNFPTVGERRGVSFIEQSIKSALQFARNQNNTPELRASVERTIRAFLLAQMRNGAFRTKDPATAFFVDVGDGLNPPSAVFAGILTARIGLATNKPAEFIVLQFSQDTRALDQELANN